MYFRQPSFCQNKGVECTESLILLCIQPFLVNLRRLRYLSMMCFQLYNSRERYITSNINECKIRNPVIYFSCIQMHPQHNDEHCTLPIFRPLANLCNFILSLDITCTHLDVYLASVGQQVKTVSVNGLCFLEAIKFALIHTYQRKMSVKHIIRNVKNEPYQNIH